MEEKNIIVINGNECLFESGETILEVARRYHIDIPTLCFLKGAPPTGKCGVCVVEIEGRSDLASACETGAAQNMVVRTETPKIVAQRREVIKKMLSSGNHNCAAHGSSEKDWTQFQVETDQFYNGSTLCPVWGDCRLQDLAFRYQVSGDRFAEPEKLYPIESVNPFIVRDFSRCIRCGRCVQACRDIQVNNAISMGEGDAARVIAGNDTALKDSDCVFCGECVQVCPVGALVEKDAAYRVRQWETKKVHTTCSYCGVGCQLYLHEKDGKIVKASGVPECAPNYGSLCVKGRFGFNFINSEDRLKTPLIKENGEFRQASWDEALNLIAKRLGEIKSQHGSDSIGVLTSARITNEENYIAQKFARAVLKTNNVDHCARL